MKYEPGRMGTSEGIGLAVIMTITSIFVSSPAFILEKMGPLAWVLPLIAGTIIISSIFLLAHIFSRFPGNLISITEQLLGKAAANVICLYYIFVFFSLAFMGLREFSENTLLIALPLVDFNTAILWYGLGAAVIVYAGIETIGRVIYLALPFIIGLILISLIATYPLWEVNYLFPWQGYGINQIAENSVGLVGMQVGVIILAIFASSFQTARTIKTAAIFGVGGICILHSVFFIVFIMVFGTKVGMERFLPLFELARLVYLNHYIQHIEAIFIFLWVIVGIVSIAASLFASLFLISRLANLATIRPLIPAITFIIVELSCLPPDVTTIIKLAAKIYLSNFFGAFILPILLFIAAIIKDRRKKSCTCEQ
ncbi:MAG: spore germination protein (amino acid permease) [Firmicutes bacterium]|nr:spore germination protein (amino acid permease) [Bacillota bacterium]